MIRLYARFIEREYKRLFLTAYCPKCRRNIDRSKIRLVTKVSADVYAVKCPYCDGEVLGGTMKAWT